MKKIILNCLFVSGFLLAVNQNALADAGGPPHTVPDSGTTMLLLTGSIAGIGFLRKAFPKNR